MKTGISLPAELAEQIEANRQATIEAEQRLTRSVIITLKSVGVEPTTMGLLRNIVSANPGRCPLYVVVTTNNNIMVVVRASGLYSVDPSLQFRHRLHGDQASFAYAGDAVAALLHLGPRPIEFSLELLRRAAVVNDDIGQGGFFFDRRLGAQEGSGPQGTDTSIEGSFELLLMGAPDDHQQIVGLPGAGFDQQSGLDDGYGLCGGVQPSGVCGRRHRLAAQPPGNRSPAGC